MHSPMPWTTSRLPDRHILGHPSCTLLDIRFTLREGHMSESYCRKLDGIHHTTVYKLSPTKTRYGEYTYLHSAPPASVTATAGTTVFGMLRALIRLTSIAVRLRCNHRSILSSKEILKIGVGARGAWLLRLSQFPLERSPKRYHCWTSC